MENKYANRDNTIKSLYEEGLSCGRISERLEIPITCIHRSLKRSGVKTRSNCDYPSLRKGKDSNTWHLKTFDVCKERNKRSASMMGRKNFRFKDGSQARPYRKVIDKAVCSNCGTIGRLGIHHKDFDHYNNAEDNLQVLCVSCHSSLHKKQYWDAIHSGSVPMKSNAPIGWGK